MQLQQRVICSIDTSFEYDEAKTCDESLPVGNSIASDNLFTRIQMMRLELHSDLALVVIDFSNNTLFVGKGDTFD